MSVRLLADENLDLSIVVGLKRIMADLDIVRVQEIGLRGISDPDLLEWAAKEDRVLITHDVNTVTASLRQRIETGLSSPGVIIVRKLAPIGQSIRDLHVMLEASMPEDLRDQVSFIPIN
jgi:predicted nuclease of predicted toxin-antitoxin system